METDSNLVCLHLVAVTLSIWHKCHITLNIMYWSYNMCRPRCGHYFMHSPFVWGWKTDIVSETGLPCVCTWKGVFEKEPVCTKLAPSPFSTWRQSHIQTLEYYGVLSIRWRTLSTVVSVTSLTILYFWNHLTFVSTMSSWFIFWGFSAEPYCTARKCVWLWSLAFSFCIDRIVNCVMYFRQFYI
jgi:hypothetical protein